MRTNENVLATNRQIAGDWLRLASFDHHDTPRSRVEAIALRLRHGQACRVIQRFEGAFDCCFRLRFDNDNAERILCFPIPRSAKQTIRNVETEVATMGFLGGKHHDSHSRNYYVWNSKR